MLVFINNEQKELRDQSTVQTLLEELQITSSRGIAVAINQEVVPKTQWTAHALKANDKITLIKATQGG